MTRILVLNPNSSTRMTAEMDDTLDPVRCQYPEADIKCATNTDGPAGIETDADVAAVEIHVAAAAKASDADALVVACFSDPGVDMARRGGNMLIVGIAEAAYMAAMGLAAGFGVISIVAASVRRHALHLDRLGFRSRMVGDRPLGLGVDALRGETVFERLVEIGTTLRDEDGAGAVILGCAGLGLYRHRLQQQLGIPVIDPVQAAVVQAITNVRLGFHTSR